MTGLFGVSAGVGVLWFFNGVPRVREDIMAKIPIIGGYFIKDIAPEDNPF